ncbi:glycosyltransferase [Streptomyces sp. NPDC046862]|uniref:glycosyltransferase n=1 Tax=Streptomyces sp. NPDC046862 TaxID=3154603 RepID=UPI003453BD4A
MESGSPRVSAPVSVAVLVELVRSGTAGGHVKCWERFAESAASLPDSVPGDPGLDLTVYFLGARERVEILSPRVRLVMLRPVLSTAALTSADGAEDVSDLAPHHPRLATLLPRHDVWHLTHCFAYSTTAARLARRAARKGAGRPRVVGSVHTDVPALASVYTRYLADRAVTALPARRDPERMPGGASDRAAEWAAGRAGAWARRRRDRLLRGCDRVLVPTPAGCEELARTLGTDRVSLLRRGIDHARFRPDGTARAWLAREHGVPTDRRLVLFAGRLDASKRVPLLAESLRLLRERGSGVHAVMVGSGAEAGAVRSVLGGDVTLLGALPQERLARVYAGCDVFGFPSRTETCGNVVAEAMASGLAVVLPEGARTTQWLAAPGRDGVVVRSDDVWGWADALGGLVDCPGLLEAMRRRAVATARDVHPSWDRVLAEDLLPVWMPGAAPVFAPPPPLPVPSPGAPPPDPRSA